MLGPGPITSSDAAKLEDFLAQVARNKRAVDALIDPRPRKFPAAVTSYDSATGRYTWYEQDYDANGGRQQKDAGRFGNTTHNPAYAFGDGQVVTDFPAPVWMYERVIHSVGGTQLGMAYEFPLYCACVGGGSGGGSYATTSCCPNPIPTTLHATISAPTYPFYDGMTFTLSYGFWNPLSPFVVCLTPYTGWGASFSGEPSTPGGYTIGVSVCLQCAFDRLGTIQWSLYMTFTGISVMAPLTESFCYPYANSLTFPICNPFSATFSGTFATPTGYAACGHAGEAFTVTITE